MSEVKPSDNLITILQPDSIASEAFRQLRTNLSLRNFDKELKVINVTSANAKEGKSTVALNLGYVYSQLNKKVLIIDLDLRLPSLHKKLKLKNTCGVTNVVAKHCAFAQAVIHYAKNYDILLAGTKTPFASEFVQSQALSHFIDECRNYYDVIILDCPPINMVTDGMIISTLTDGTILCVASNHDEKADLEKAKDLLLQFKTNVIGIVMTRMPLNKKRYSYDYGYGYGNNHQSKKNKKNQS